MNIRFLLINPFYPISETPSPPLGLAYLAATLTAAGVEVRILDLVVTPYSRDRMEHLLAEFNPHLVGATAVTMTFNHAVQVLSDVKDICPDVVTVMGGPHVTFCAEKTLQDHPVVDIVALGEADETIVELAQAVRARTPLDAVAGIAYRQGDRTVVTTARPFIKNLDLLPDPARHLLPLGRYLALGMPISMTTSRGCPFQCIFCVGRKMVGAKVRYRHPLRVVDELAYLATLGFHQINIADDLFTACEAHCLAICDEIMRRNLSVKWTSFARVDTVSTTVLARMRAAGCSAVSFGVESGSPEMLKRVKKGITLDQVLKAVEMCNDTGVTPFASFILGLPGETPETIKETMDFGEKLKAMGVGYGFHLLAPFPGTAVREQVADYDLTILTHDWSQYHANRAIVATKAVTPETLDRIVIDWEEAFNRYLGDIKERFLAGTISPEESFPWTNLVHIVRVYDLMMAHVVEEQGAFALATPYVDAASAAHDLAGRLRAVKEHSAAELAESIRALLKQGTLAWEWDAGQVRWYWRDRL